MLGQTHTQVKGSIQSLQESGLGGHGVAYVFIKLELLQPLLTCCLVAGTPWLPARGFAAFTCPCSTAGTGSQPPVGTETSAYPPSPCWRRAMRLLKLCEEPGTQGACDYFKAGDRSSVGTPMPVGWGQ